MFEKLSHFGVITTKMFHHRPYAISYCRMQTAYSIGQIRVAEHNACYCNVPFDSEEKHMSPNRKK